MARPVEKAFRERMLSGAKVERVLELLKQDTEQFEALYNSLPRDRQSRADLLAKIAELEAQLSGTAKKSKPTARVAAH